MVHAKPCRWESLTMVDVEIVEAANATGPGQAYALPPNGQERCIHIEVPE